jgi:hypothetical protein
LNDIVAASSIEKGKGRCAACNEALKEVWIDEHEGWYFRGAVLGGNGSIYHSTCYKEFLV